jgi:2,5-diamino-6-(ribosylamino)-4(3H)-pyrimidinone 5'-phosphate reductase
MLPRVILHNAVSLDGRITKFDADIALFYRLAATWAEDATLVGSETILAAAGSEGLEDDPYPPAPEAPADQLPPEATVDQPPGQAAPTAQGVHAAGEAPLLVVPDSRGRVRCWSSLLSQPYWSRGVALCSRTTPPVHLSYLGKVGVRALVAGEDRIDLRAALHRLHTELGVSRVRADGGGRLNGALLQTGLVDEISLLVHPVLVGDARSAAVYHPPAEPSPDPALHLDPLAAETQPGGLIWLRYRVLRDDH